MGAELIYRTARGKNIQDAFKRACQDDEDYYGHQEGYSGGLHTCDLTKDVTSMAKTKSSDEIGDYIADNARKREAWGYCVEEPVANKNKVKSQVDVTPQKGTRKWETVYKAVTSWDQREVARDKSQTNCIKKARAYVEQHPDISLKVIISKELVEGNSQCASVTYKKATNEKLGLYKFVAWAAC
jgi:hypothetical protein